MIIEDVRGFNGQVHHGLVGDNRAFVRSDVTVTQSSE